MGGEGGYSLKNIIDGTHKAVIIIDWDSTYMLNSDFSNVSEADWKKMFGSRKLIRHPTGLAMLPKAVAIPLYIILTLIITIPLYHRTK